MIRLSVRGLAKYIVSSPSAQLKVLQDFKYPKADEPFAMRTFYIDALRAIAAFHRDRHSTDWLRSIAGTLGEQSRSESGSGARRLAQNARAITQYQQYFSTRSFDVLQPPRLRLIQENVTISVAPDLYVMESGRAKMIKFQYGGKELSDQAIKVITQCLLTAAKKAGHEMSANSVSYLDLPRGVAHTAPRSGARVWRDIDAACRTIALVWEAIPPPRPSRRANAA